MKRNTFFEKALSLLLVLSLLVGLTASLTGCGLYGAYGAYETDDNSLGELLTLLDDELDEYTGIGDGEDLPPTGEAEQEQEQSLELLPDETPETEALLPEDGSYYSKDEVALYLHQYGHLPGNYIKKNDAKKLGWEGGSLEKYAPGKAIGGDYFGNYEGLLPSGHTYTECDIDTLGASSRGAKRIIFSSDGLIYYTDDHYESFTLLYGEE